MQDYHIPKTIRLYNHSGLIINNIDEYGKVRFVKIRAADINCISDISCINSIVSVNKFRYVSDDTTDCFHNDIVMPLIPIIMNRRDTILSLKYDDCRCEYRWSDLTDLYNILNRISR